MNESAAIARPTLPDHFRKRWEEGNLEEGYVAGVLAGLEFYVLVTPRWIRRPGETAEAFNGQKDLLVGLDRNRLPHVRLEVKSLSARMTWDPGSLPWDPFSICNVREARRDTAYAIVSQITGAIIGHLPGRGERFIGQQIDHAEGVTRPRMQIRRKDCVPFEALVLWLRDEASR